MYFLLYPTRIRGKSCINDITYYVLNSFAVERFELNIH